VAEEDSGEESAAAAQCHGGKRRVKQPGRRDSIQFCSSAWLQERGKRKRENTWPGAEQQAAPACLTGSVAAARGICPTWRDEGRPAWATQVVERGIERRVEQGAEGTELQGGTQDRAGAAACSRGENREKTGLGKMKGTWL
jgi:hypothetical protein